jgi:hypothetical protein
MQSFSWKVPGYSNVSYRNSALVSNVDRLNLWSYDDKRAWTWFQSTLAYISTPLINRSLIIISCSFSGLLPPEIHEEWGDEGPSQPYMLPRDSSPYFYSHDGARYAPAFVGYNGKSNQGKIAKSLAYVNGL